MTFGYLSTVAAKNRRKREELFRTSNDEEKEIYKIIDKMVLYLQFPYSFIYSPHFGLHRFKESLGAAMCITNMVDFSEPD